MDTLDALTALPSSFLLTRASTDIHAPTSSTQSVLPRACIGVRAGIHITLTHARIHIAIIEAILCASAARFGHFVSPQAAGHLVRNRHMHVSALLPCIVRPAHAQVAVLALVVPLSAHTSAREC
eukprot:4388751-Pleurochrysis_carterae.AAC.2